jgi:hypothetical protein
MEHNSQWWSHTGRLTTQTQTQTPHHPACKMGTGEKYLPYRDSSLHPSDAGLQPVSIPTGLLLTLHIRISPSMHAIKDESFPPVNLETMTWGEILGLPAAGPIRNYQCRQFYFVKGYEDRTAILNYIHTHTHTHIYIYIYHKDDHAQTRVPAVVGLKMIQSSV